MKNLLEKLGFSPKENSKNIFSKIYKNNYEIEIDFEQEIINYGEKIISNSKTTQNFSQEENWVVLECVNRLLEKGYNPEDIILEKVYPTGHGTSGRLDILVLKNSKAFLMIECKTYGKEFEKEFAKMQSKGGQLLTYFIQDRDAEFLVLYASELKNGEIFYKNEIITIEDSYRETSNLEDLYERWNKLTKQNGIFDDWVNAYNFESRALTYKDLVDIRESDAPKIFNRFLEILRHNTVSDKPNAFNKMFNLFLCKVCDEIEKDGKLDELEFQWKEGKDDNEKFQIRLTDLYKRGMKKFFDKEVSDFSDEDFKNQFGGIIEGEKGKEILKIIQKLRLQKNNEFAIKDVYDEETFKDNAKVIKEIVQLLEGFKLRYSKKQPFLGEFFELLLTTGLKQEAGQFFTPVPVARFICKSIPIEKMIEEKLENDEFLPTMIDYAAGSGHFLTEAMEEIQDIINKKDFSKYGNFIKNKMEAWKGQTYDWASDYIYGIEKDYRLVKTSKVGCYLNGDGIANVIHGNGLDSFEFSKNYRGKLSHFLKDAKSQNEQFDLVLSNPPYSVSAFKSTLKRELAEKDFELYKYLTEQSSEIEALFIERTSQLLRENGIAAIVLPSSILSNTGIYTKAREIILKNFEIKAIAEFGSNTFMATGTNTVTLFLKKRNRFFAENIFSRVENFFKNFSDVTINGIENPVEKYISEIWENINFEDYKSMVFALPNEKISNHPIFKEYKAKMKFKNEKDFFEKIREIEKEKIFYFILTYSQNIVLVKSGEKNIEKEFLGYEFSNRRGSEGIHPIVKGKQIDDCTKLFDKEIFDNKTKASTYIYKNLEENIILDVDESLKNHIFPSKVSDLLTFDRVDFEKNISLSVKKNFKIESKWEIVALKLIAKIEYGERIVKKDAIGEKYPVYGGGGETFRIDNYNRENAYIISRFGMSPNCVRFVKGKFFLNDSGMTLEGENINQQYLNLYLFLNQEMVYDCGRGVGQKNIDIEKFYNIQIPLPPKEIQQKIVDEIEKIENQVEENKEKIQNLKTEIEKIITEIPEVEIVKIGEICKNIFAGGDAPKENFSKTKTEEFQIPIFSNGVENNGLYGYTNKARVEENCLTVSARGTIGFTVERTEPFVPIVRLIVLIVDENNVNQKFLKYVLNSMKFQQSGGVIPQLTVPQISDIKIPLPSLELQNFIVEEIEKLEKNIGQLEENNDNILLGINKVFEDFGIKLRSGEVEKLRSGEVEKLRSGEVEKLRSGEMDNGVKKIKRFSSLQSFKKGNKGFRGKFRSFIYSYEFCK